MKKVSLGVIGCGIAARKLHLPALRKLPDRFEITAVCNHTKPKAVDFARMVGGVPYYLDYRDLLGRADVEAVDIVLPIELNYRVTRDALEAGKHVILEKPLAANLTEAKKMLAFPRRYSRVMMVAENCRYQPTFLRAGRILADGSLGTPYAVIWDVFQTLSADNMYARTAWRIHHRYAGGFLTDAGVHNAAVLRMLFGEIREIHATTASINPAIGRLDTMSMLFTTARGVHGVFNLFFSATGHSERRLKVFGTRGTLIVEDGRLTLKRPGRRDSIENSGNDGGYIGEFEEFHKAITGGRKVRSTFDEGYRDLRVILSAVRAAGTRSKRALLPRM